VFGEYKNPLSSNFRMKLILASAWYAAPNLRDAGFSYRNVSSIDENPYPVNPRTSG